MARRTWQGFAGAFVALCVASCSGGATTAITIDGSVGSDGGHVGPDGTTPPGPDGSHTTKDASHAKDAPPAPVDSGCGGPCEAGTACTVGGDCASGVCTAGMCVAPTDHDGVMNDSETGVDCGGATLANGMPNPASDGAPACAIGTGCKLGTDCVSESCQAGKCVAATCMDGMKDGMETDVDCGGPTCNPCPTGDKCALPTDCESGACTSGACTPPACSPTCPDGNACGAVTDCASGVCTANKCAAPSCAPTCIDGNVCGAAGDCASGVCTNGKCAPPACAPTCVDGNACGALADCASGVCTNGTCAPPTCAPDCVDGNVCGAGTDCGSGVCTNGKCAPPACGPTCADGNACGAATDCASGVCTGGKCAPPACAPTCVHGNVCGANSDCGSDLCTSGECAPPACAPSCVDGNGCGATTDCASDVCTAGKCAAPACAPTCPDGNVCGATGDCASDLCTSGKCAPPACAPACVDGNICGANGDCASDVCTGSKCAPPPCAPACVDTNVCGAATDCASGVCTAGKCAPPACSPSCLDGNVCGANTDCLSGTCTGGKCVVPACSPSCADAARCISDTDCLSGFCSTLSNTCVAGQSCVGLVTAASIMTVTGTNGAGDGTGVPNANGAGQHAGIDTCGKGEATDSLASQAHESCCRSLVIPASVLPGTDVAGSRLDKYEVTAGRMRQFIESVDATEYKITGQQYDLYDWMAAQFAADMTTPTTPIGTRFAAQVPAGTTVKALIELLPSVWYGAAGQDNIVAALGGTTMDPAYPSTEQGCYVSSGAFGATTYWWPAKTNQGVTPVIVGGDVVGDGPRPLTQDYYDIKSMNCAPYYVYAAFCAWDGGHVATLAELDAVYGKQQYPWDTVGEATFLPAAYTYTTTGGHSYQNFVPGTAYYTGAVKAGTAGFNAVDLTVNWNNNSFSANYGNFYFYPNGGTGPTDEPASVLSGLDLTPYIAAPGRFYLDKTAILSPSGAGTEGWQDLGANMLEITSTGEGGATVFCDCSTGGQAAKPAACSTACPNTTPVMYPIVRNGGTGFPSMRWEGGSWEGHETANPASPPYFSDNNYTEPIQTQYGKASFRCARAPE